MLVFVYMLQRIHLKKIPFSFFGGVGGLAHHVHMNNIFFFSFFLNNFFIYGRGNLFPGPIKTIPKQKPHVAKLRAAKANGLELNL